MKYSAERAHGEHLVAFLENELSEAETIEVERELQINHATAEKLEQLKRIRRALAAPLPGVDDLDLSASIMQSMRESRLATPHKLPWPRKPQHVLAQGVLAAAACLVVIQLGKLQGPQSGRELQPRAVQVGGGETEPDGTALRIYTVGLDAAARSFSGEMRASDGLVLSYVNSLAASFRYLMVFGQDAKHQLRWYYPAFEQVGTDPISIPIEVTDREPRQLSEVIEHDLPVGPMTLYAVFSNTPLHVQDLEQAVRRGRALRDYLGARAAVHTIRVRVIK